MKIGVRKALRMIRDHESICLRCEQVHPWTWKDSDDHTKGGTWATPTCDTLDRMSASEFARRVMNGEEFKDA